MCCPYPKKHADKAVRAPTCKFAKVLFTGMAVVHIIVYLSDLPARLIDDAGVEDEKLELSLSPLRPGCNYLATAVRLGREHGRNITLRIYYGSTVKSD